jgi:hypothetical protein
MQAQRRQLENMKFCVESRLRDLLQTENIYELQKAKESYQLIVAKIANFDKLYPECSRSLTSNCESKCLNKTIPKSISLFANFTEMPLESLTAVKVAPVFVEKQIRDTQEINESFADDPRVLPTSQNLVNEIPNNVSFVPLPVFNPQETPVIDGEEPVFTEETKKTLQMHFDVPVSNSYDNALGSLIPAAEENFEL